MKKILPLLFLIISSTQLLQAQQWAIHGKVLDKNSKQPLPFVNIIIKNTHIGTASDIDGNFELTVPQGEQILQVSYIGYEPKSIPIQPQNTNLHILLKETTSELQEVTIFPGENPAHRIIRNAVANKEKNDPENLPSFSYKTYSKFVATINSDSLDTSIDTLEINTSDTSYTQYDSSNFELAHLLKSQYLFMMETVTERKYLPPSRDNETVLASRTSGFSNPLFSLVITQLQSFSFYGDYISILGEDFLNPITKGSTGRYFFLIEDTTYNSPEDTVFVISFRPRPNYGFKPLKGVVYINSADWAIQSVIAEPVENQGTRISIEQRYKAYAPHVWFPDQLSAEIHFGTLKVNDVTPIARVRTYLKDVNVGGELQKKDISRAEVTIDELAVSNADKILNTYRVDSISSKEAKTYAFMDSLSKAENLERRLRGLIALMQGKIPVWIFDLDVNKILSYNDYEGFRLGMGAHTNSHFSRWFKAGGYFGYGFKDEVLKYGWDAEITLHEYTNLRLMGGYQFEIFETGGINFIQDPNTGLFSDNYRRLFITQWDETSRYFAGITYDPLPTTHLKIQAQRENRYTIGDYYFNNSPENGAGFENGFNYFELTASLRYSPREKFVEGPGFGKLTFETGYPVIHLQYTRGLKDVFDSEFDYDKIDLRVEHRIKTIALGISSFEVQGGTMLQDVPYSKLYVATANQIKNDDFWKRSFMIADRHSFETMRFNEFVSDTYFHFLFRQDFKSLLFRRDEFAPHVEVVARAIWGDLRSPGLHENISVQSLNKGYYETGIELNKLYTENFLSLGLGFYYRLGQYSLPTFAENFAIKFTSKYTF